MFNPLLLVPLLVGGYVLYSRGGGGAGATLEPGKFYTVKFRQEGPKGDLKDFISETIKPWSTSQKGDVVKFEMLYEGSRPVQAHVWFDRLNLPAGVTLQSAKEKITKEAAI